MGDFEKKSESNLCVLTDSTFFQEISKHELFVLDFWAPWCGPCKEISPVIEELAGKYAGKAAFGKLNVDENPIASDTFGVDNIPAIFIFRRGRPVDNLVGIVTKSSIEEFFETYLNGNLDTGKP